MTDINVAFVGLFEKGADATGLIVVALAADLPAVGKVGRLYYAEDTRYFYYWDTGAPGYIAITEIGEQTYIDLVKVLEDPARKEARFFYDPVHKCISLYNDIDGFIWQLGREVPKRVKNVTGGKLLNGRIVTAVGISDGVVEIDYATAADPTSATNAFGALTHDLEDFSVDGDFGEVTVLGDVRGFDTSHLTAGARTYLSADVPATGLLTSTRPPSPAYTIEMGGCLVSDVANGLVFTNVENRGNTADVVKIFNGAILEDHSVTVTSDGVTVTATLDDTGDSLSLFYDADFSPISVPASVALTPGTDLAPAVNYVYIPKSTKVMTISPSGFPTGEQFTPVATVVCQSAASVQTDGPYKVHAWTDHLADSVGQGHLAHLNKWIRKQHATYLGGVTPSFSGSGTGTVQLSTTPGNVLQLHEHSFPAFAEPADIFAINHDTTPYLKVTNIASLLSDSAGTTLANKSFALVFWGVVSQDDADCKIFVNLPGGSYPSSKPDDANADLSRYTNYSIPDGYKGTGFLIHRMIASFNPAGTVLTIHPYPADDIRGQFPNTVAGGAGAIDTLPASSITFTPYGVWTSVDLQALGQEQSDRINSPNSYQIAGVLGRANDPTVLGANDPMAIDTDHYEVFTLATTGTMNITFPNIANNREFYKTMDVEAGSLASLTITADAARDVKGAVFDIATWFAENLVESDTTRIIWHQVVRSDGLQRINLTVVPLSE